MKRMFLAITVVCAVSMLSAAAMAESIEGSVQGFTCVTQGKVCPIGQEDPVIAAENVFVVLTANKTFYFVPNIDRGIMARHLNEKVRIEGKMSAKYNSIEAEKIYNWKNSNWNKVWDERMQHLVINDLRMPPIP